jgi:hypothetical protein
VSEGFDLLADVKFENGDYVVVIDDWPDIVGDEGDSNG